MPPDNNVLRPNHPRVRKARWRRHAKQFFALGLVLTIILIAGAAALLVMQNPLGWLPAGFAAPFIMLACWAKIDLRHLSPGSSEDINDRLSGDVINILLKHNTPVEAAKPLLLDTVSGRFLALRFGLFPDLIEQAAANSSLEQIFITARSIAADTGAAQISGAIMVTAIIKNCPNYEELLASFKIDMADLYAGITWYNYLHDLSTLYARKVHSGGIARDLNFGYIPTLQHFGYNISENPHSSARSQIARTARKEALDKMLQIFSGAANQSIALIGPEGCGKSIVVKAFAACLQDDSLNLPSNLRYRQVFELDATALLSAAGSGRGELESLLNQLFSEAYAAKNIILYLNNAQLFFKDATGAVDLSNLLFPILEAGRLRIILSIEEQDFLRLSAGNSGLMGSVNRIMIAPTDPEDTMRVLEDQTPYFESRFKVIYEYQALKEAIRLGDRYVTDRAMPGRALRLLELGAEYAEDHGLVTANSIQQAVEKSFGVKIRVATTSGDRNTLLSLEQLIHQRMIGQDPAIATVASALRRAAAGVRNESRPIGTFLFLGPTGVGKTELAKAISEVYFGGESEIVRVDLNEYVNADSVDRLIADATIDPESLTAQISKHPFSVVLLDEIEKAHPAVLTTLLQLLDEGVLRDINNHEVSFRDAIVVCTSNAGANHIREYIQNGTPLAEVKDQIVSELVESGEFKPEFLNRFDEICIFEPLSQSDIEQIVDIVIAGVNRTLEPQKIQVVLTPEAKALLAEKGYDPVFGARPLRRVVEKSVENIVAKSILQGFANSGSAIQITPEQIRQELG